MLPRLIQSHLCPGHLSPEQAGASVEPKVRQVTLSGPVSVQTHTRIPEVIKISSTNSSQEMTLQEISPVLSWAISVPSLLSLSLSSPLLPTKNLPNSLGHIPPSPLLSFPLSQFCIEGSGN